MKENTAVEQREKVANKVVNVGNVTLTDELEALRDRGAWKVMIVYAEEQGT